MRSSTQTHAVQLRSHAHTRASSQEGTPLGLVLLIESASFFAAAFAHHGMLAPVQTTGDARVLELSIGSFLLLSAIGSWLAPERAHSIGFAAQSTALVATSAGLLALAVGLSGPLYTYHLVFNAGVLLLLHLGLVLVSRTR